MGVSIFSDLEQIPYDEAYTVLQAFNQDPSPEKITLGAGVYRDDNAKPWTLPSVKLVISLDQSQKRVMEADQL